MDTVVRPKEVASAPAVASAHATGPTDIPALALPPDRISECYRGEILTEETSRAARDRIHWMCAQCAGDSVLDVGCSQGITSILLAREGFTVTAIDPHPESVAYARDEIARETALVQGRITLLETDLAGLPTQARFDTIVLGNVIEHQAVPVRLLRAAKTHLDAGGRLVLTAHFGRHPHPDHKVSLFPRDLVEFAAQIDMHVSGLETDGDYMRCVLVGDAGPATALTTDSLLRATEAATLRSEERLFARLDDVAEQLKKESDALRITKRKLTEATTTLESKAREHAAELKTARVRHESAVETLKAEHQRALGSAKTAQTQSEAALAALRRQHATEVAALQARFDQAERETSKAFAEKQARLEESTLEARSKLDRSELALRQANTARDKAEEAAGQLRGEVEAVGARLLEAIAAREHEVEALQAQLLEARATRKQEIDALQAQLLEAIAARKHEIEALQAQLREVRAAHKHQLAQVNARNERLKDRIGAMSENMRATKATTSYRFGRLLVHGCKSPRAFLRLPSGLWELWRDVRSRRRTRTLLATADVENPLPQGATNDAIPARVVSDVSDRPERDAVVPVRPAQSPAAPAPVLDSDVSVDALQALYDRDGLSAVNERVRRARASLGGRLLATRLLHLGKHLADKHGSEVGFATAQIALKLDRSEQTLRGYFWMAQRSRNFEAASDAIAALARCYGKNPTEQQQAILEKLRVSPAYQLSTLKLVPARSENPVAAIRGRVCYVLHNSLPYSSGGYATRSQGVASGLRQAGREVIVLTRPGFPLDITTDVGDMAVPAEDVIDGITYVRTLDPKRRGLSMVRYVTAAADAIEQQLRRLQPEIVMAASNHVTALPTLIAARRVGLPFIYEVRGLWEITRSSREEEFQDTAAFAVQSLLEAKVAQLADQVFTLTEPMREELAARGVPAERIKLLPNSCNPDRFLPRSRDQALADRLGIPAGVAVIGYIGTFVDYEGLEDLALACALLKKRGVTFRLLLVGNENASGKERGPITEQILRIAANEGIGDWLIMPGRVPHEEVEAYYSLIDIAPFPRKPWPVCEMVSPMKPLEALAMEKAVLVSSVRALTEMIAVGQTGSVFEKGNVASLADKLAELIVDPALRARLGRAGRAWVCAERTWKQVGQLFETVATQLTRG